MLFHLGPSVPTIVRMIWSSSGSHAFMCLPGTNGAQKTKQRMSKLAARARREAVGGSRVRGGLGRGRFCALVSAARHAGD